MCSERTTMDSVLLVENSIIRSDWEAGLGHLCGSHLILPEKEWLSPASWRDGSGHVLQLVWRMS